MAAVISRTALSNLRSLKGMVVLLEPNQDRVASRGLRVARRGRAKRLDMPAYVSKGSLP